MPHTEPRDLQPDYALFEHALLLEEYAEPNTFTTRAHQETLRALLAKEQKV